MTKLQKSFNKIKNYTYLKKHQKEQEQIIKKEKENKIQSLNNKLNTIGNSLYEINHKISILKIFKKKSQMKTKILKIKQVI